ncbi:BrnT family toxin [Aliihoeflea sp. 40Bstr573]|uniref:BrnT family toxin n=1 Tax=Aliihoeflea sp. 40Bstr573 TaxID=2696467 RepID=UPI0020940B1A|nr:BrnT family toxin [Aliihoeflea sp. 40Bstr573]MCO6388443.1 BrnT family toxin [Aliihoeflea sp. 40Bstr573]
MTFEWDEAKNRTNIAKHGLSFATACRIFEGPVLTAIDDRFEYGEVRRNSIGAIEGVFVLVVTHTDRNGTTRIISARPAKRVERNTYEEALRQGIDP